MKMKKLMVAALAAAITVGSALPASAALVQSGPSYKYQNNDGSYQTNAWVQDDGKWYHFDVEGYAQKGWFKDTDGKWYFLAYNGVMQTGLIKVDDNVYFMNTDGSLFVGKKEVSNTEYDFTEYGTTNGKPSVVASQTWASNGNQTGVVTGGGHYSSPSSSSSSSSSNSDSTAVTTVKNEVQTVVESTNNNNTYVDAKISGQKITVSPKSSETQLKDVLDTADSILDDIREADGVSSVKYGETEITSEADLVKIALKENLSGSTKLEDVKGSYKITVTLDNGETVNYTITI